MIECPNIQKKVIRNHYDVSTLFYWLLWGRHIHHGFWLGDETPRVAQEQLVRKLADLASIEQGSTLYDIGCGMGGSSRWLSTHRQCNVTGVTLSPIQRGWATVAARFDDPLGHARSPRPSFVCDDAEAIEFPPESADVVWSVECTEHLFEKGAFFAKGARWLKPGGRIALCAWLAGHTPLDSERTAQAVRVCEGMFCPSLGTQSDYVGWLESAGLQVTVSEIWTRQVERTWEICRRRVERTGVRHLARLLGQNHVLFLDRFDAILNAYQSGAMEYGCFVAEKPR